MEHKSQRPFSKFEKILGEFCLGGKPVSVVPYGEGHINSTFLVTTDKKRFILQEMNTHVFHDPKGLMENIVRVTDHLEKKGVETLKIVPTRQGENFLSVLKIMKEPKEQECWRVYDFLEGTVTYQSVTDPSVFEKAGAAFGEFQNQLADFDAGSLTETIPDFHNTPKRYEQFERALAEDRYRRASFCREEIKGFCDRKDTLSRVTEELRKDLIPLRVTHNDTKLNNILMDERTGSARAIIDLDTVMPGSLLYDFGESIRFGASAAREDEKDLSKVKFDTELFRAYTRGFCRAVKNTLTPEEIRLLPYSAYLLTMECGLRFLTDYLSGDSYFSIAYPEHNLVRARTQLCLAYQMEEKTEKMAEIVRLALE